MDAYQQGVSAALNGKPKTANPFKDGTADYTLWRAGWRDGSMRNAA